MLRGRSKDRDRKVTPPGPSYMSNDEFADYLKGLRNNRVARPTGARPQPVSSRRESTKEAAPEDVQSQSEPPANGSSRSASTHSHHRARSSLSTYSSVTSRTGRQLAQPPQPSRTQSTPLKASDVVPSATYIERGQRWMEKEEAVSLRDALEDMDLKKAEEEAARIHAAAQDEASELVFRHQNPQSIPQPGAPYSYLEHLRKNSYQHARSASVGKHAGSTIATGLARDMGKRSVSGGSNASAENSSSGESVSRDSNDVKRSEVSMTELEETTRPGRKSYGSVKSSSGPLSSRRRSSAKRNISGEMTGAFTGEQIWEEPEQESDRGRSVKTEDDMPAPLRFKPRNPLSRVQFVHDSGNRSSSTPPETTKRLSTYDIHKNPPSQSRDPNYTYNPTPPLVDDHCTEAVVNKDDDKPQMKDGKEIRSDEIRKATSMFLKDRSPKLPTPTAVSDRPGRPIVSFETDWKPKEADEKPEVRRRSPFDRYNGSNERQSLPASSAAKNRTPPVSALDTSNSTSIKVDGVIEKRLPHVSPHTIRPTGLTSKHPQSTPAIPTINFPDSDPVPHINLPESKPPVPTINFPDSGPSIPTMNFPDSAQNSTPDIPLINVPEPPVISVSGPADARRALPNPSIHANKSTQRPLPVPRGHWSPAAGKRATAMCHQCQLPIEGRVVKLSGAPENFHPQCFICFCCGTGLESLEIRPEPSTHRQERIDRIRRRAQGEQLPEIEGQTYAEDGDQRLRFYCHLDWHENFAPRCKHCKTPIMEEHLVALGEHWHYGHFFCAECGDPFEKGVSHIEKDGYAWCIGCQTKRTERRAPKCKKCKQPVIGEYVQALGGEWHDKCFRCVSCHGGFDDGAFFPKIVGTETVVLCTKCIERELKA